MSAELKRSDIIEDAAFKVPREYAKEWQVPIDQLDVFIAKMKTLGATIQSSNSIPKLKEDTVQLTVAQKELEKIQNSITVAQAKSTDAYIAQKKVLDDVNQSTKNKTALGDKDAKSVDAQTASIKQLGSALAANKKAYADLTGDQQRNSAQGQQLKKIIDEQDKSFKTLKSSIGENQEKVGAYREELEGLLVVQDGAGIGMQGLITGVRQLGKAFLALLANPVFLAFAALAVVVGAAKKAVEAFFETTGEGELEAERLSASFDAFFQTAKVGFASLGKSLYEGIGGENGVKGILYTLLTFVSTSLAATYAKASFEGDKFANAAHEVNEKLIKDIIDKAKAELDADILTINSHDKLNFSDVQRLAFAKEAFAIRTQQSAIEKSLAEEQLEVTFKQIGIAHSISSEQVKQLFSINSLVLKEGDRRLIAEAIANVYTKQNDILNLNKRLVSEISTIEIEIDKRETEAIRSKYSTQRDLRLAEYDAQGKINENIIKNVKSTQDEITQAIVNASFLRQATLAEQNEKELDSARHAAEDRVRATGIYNAEEIAEIIKKDQVLLNEQKTINTKYSQALKDEDKELSIKLNTNVFTRLQKDYDNLTNNIKTKSNDQLNALEKTFIAGGKTFGDTDISTVQNYEIAKKAIIDKADRDILIAQSKFLTDQIDKLNISNEEKLKLYTAISKAEVDITNKDADKIAAIEKRKADLKIALQNQVFASAQQIIQDNAQAQTDDIDNRIKQLQDQAQNEIALAGDNQAQKDIINEKEKASEKALNNEKASILRRAAIYEKALAITQSIINTEQAATKALAEGGPVAGPILEAIVLATGAIQIAAIAARPIPQYYKGTDSAIGGPALVGEKGTEMYISPSGNLGFTPSVPTIMNLERGTKVFTHDETMSAVATANMGGSTMDDKDEYLNERFINKLDEVKKAISQSKPDRISYVSNGLELLEVTHNKKAFTIMRRSLTMGKWNAK